MVKAKQSNDFHIEDIEAGLNEQLSRAAELQQRDPEQALRLISEVVLLATEHKLPYQLGAAHKICGNISFLQGEYGMAKKCYLSALVLARKAANGKLKGDLYFNLGRVSTKLKDYPAALKQLQKSLVFRSESGCTTDEISSMIHLGQACWDMQDYQQSVKWFQTAAERCDATISAKQTASVYNNLGNALVKTDKMPQAMEAYIHSLKLKETFGNPSDLATANLNLGNLFHTTAEYEVALAYYLKAEGLYKVAGDQKNAAIVQSNIGSTYSELKDYERAEIFHRSSLEYFRQNSMNDNHAKALNNIGNIYLHKADYQNAVTLYRESLDLKSEFYNPESLAITCNNLSECYYCLGMFPSALDYTQKSMRYSNQTQSKMMLLNNYTLLGKIYAGLKDYRNAYEALESHRLLDLEVYNTDKATILAKMMARYDAESKSKEIESLKTDRDGLEERVEQQVKDKIRYLQLYRTKLEEVKKRKSLQVKLKKVNAELESKIRQALHDYQMQQQFVIQKSKLESLGVMAAGMAHEINQPLSAITMGLNNLRLKAVKSELDETYITGKIQKMNEDIQRIRRVIEHVRQFSRDQVNTAQEKIDLHQTIRDAVEMIAYDLDKQQIRLKLQLTTSVLTTVGSKFKLEQVFLNLLSNARDAIREQRMQAEAPIPEYQIEITTTKHDTMAEVVFMDNGTGMAETSIAKMFDPFYTTKSPEKGTGLGLSISYGIITEMGGKIKVSSVSGSYTRIVVTLPILEEK